jgi:RNA polymerase sigma factor (sigma-70 family)
MRHRSTMRRRAREQLAAGPESVEPPQVDVDVLAAVGALSTRQRAVVFLTYWHDLAPNEIADLLDISPGSVRRHLARGRERLKDRLR